MKTLNLNFSKVISVMLLAVFMLMVSDIVAQRNRANSPRGNRAFEEQEDRQGREMGLCQNLPGITQEQTDQIDALRLKNIKDSKQMHNQLGEKHARLHTLSTADAPDTEAINTLIDEMAVIRANIEKNRMATHQEIRKLLTEEQRVIFDNSGGPGKRGFGAGKDKGIRGRGEYRGDCRYKK